MVLLVVAEQPGDRAGRLVAARGDEIAQLEHERLDVHVGQPGHALSAMPGAQHPKRTVGARAGVREVGGVVDDRADADDGVDPVADPVDEFAGDAHGPFLAVVLVALYRDQPVGDIADQRRGRSAGAPR